MLVLEDRVRENAASEGDRLSPGEAMKQAQGLEQGPGAQCR